MVNIGRFWGVNFGSFHFSLLQGRFAWYHVLHVSCIVSRSNIGHQCWYIYILEVKQPKYVIICVCVGHQGGGFMACLA